MRAIVSSTRPRIASAMRSSAVFSDRVNCFPAKRNAIRKRPDFGSLMMLAIPLPRYTQIQRNGRCAVYPL